MSTEDILFSPIGQNETTELLIRARGFVERGWCRDAMARDAAGNEVWPTDDRATSWCAIGAILAACEWPQDGTASPSSRFYVAMSDRLRASVDGLIGEFNNAQKTAEPVLAAFDWAIAAGQR